MTKLTREIARKQAGRLRSCPILTPRDEAAAEVFRREVVDALMRNCQSGEHAETVVTQFLETARDPKNATAELVAIARATATAEQPPAGCERCYLGPDLDTGVVRYAAHVSRTVAGYDVAGRCECVRGRWLAAKDAERRRDLAPRKAPHEYAADADWRSLAAGDGPEAA